ncbi:ejaculatory bulb-specific protein 3-like [Polyergus mexicanus]|uniref:ejaculatory bulb-specific protein 3-like n=1 Tax=Polyergus mexicanus TaxID=615972 RepID=UPI0038B68421
MKIMARLLCTIAIIGIALMCVLAKEDKYDDKYDNIDILEILNNNKLRKQYYNCFMGITPCITADSKFFNKIIGEALQTQCRKCTEKQKYMLEEIIDWYRKNEPESWNRFVEKTLEDIKRKAGENNS